MIPETKGVAAIILAAGSSRRMGQANKLLLSFNGKPLVEHVVGAVSAARVCSVHVVSGFEAAEVTTALEAFDVDVVHNPDHEQGMGTSVRAGVAAAGASVAGYMICLSDLPLIETWEYDAVIAAFEQQRATDDHAIVVPQHRGVRGNPVIIASSYHAQILNSYGGEGLKGMIRAHSEHVFLLEMETDHVTRDVDTPEEYAKLRG